MNQELEEKIKREIPADDSTSLGEKMLMYWLIRETKPKVVVETGTHRGLTTLYLAAALEDNGVGSIDTCDPYDNWGQYGNFAKFLELKQRITFHTKKGADMLALHPGNIDFAFIDGFHGKDDVLPEIDMLMSKLSSRAIVVFHDCWYANTDGVNEALEEYGLVSLWLGTKNALRIYSKHEKRPTG